VLIYIPSITLSLTLPHQGGGNNLRLAYDFYGSIFQTRAQEIDIRAAFGSIKRYERGREVKNLHCPATVKGTKAVKQ
jgi:hypothetical protein